VPHTGALFVDILLEAGLPPEVISLVHGRGPEVGAAIVAHPDVGLISFTGSTETGREIAQACGRLHKRLSLEMGGKNAQIVMPDADLELALDGVLWGAFGTTGQRCTATSRLLLHTSVHEEFLDALVGRARALKLGDGLQPGTDVGPLINERALRKVTGYMDVARDEGVILCGGAKPKGNEVDGGFFFEPTVVRDVASGSRMATEEIFGPVLSVIEIADFDEAVRINNEVRYGLSSSIYTNDVRNAYRAFDELETGITYVNAPTIGAEAHLPFGGVKETGNGHREGGWEVYDFFSETKVCYLDYSGRLQRAQIDNS
jgi:acyl-CoA reductase-like NAD-dependent aldehyde dehydrogenase